jgi:hypothetical protein
MLVFLIFLVVADFVLGVFLGAFGGAAIIYPLTVTRRVMRAAKHQGLIDRTPLSPILLPPLLWLIIIPTITYANFRFLPHVTLSYYLGMAIALVRIIANIHNPVNEQEAIEQNKRCYKKQPTQSFKQ